MILIFFRQHLLTYWEPFDIHVHVVVCTCSKFIHVYILVRRVIMHSFIVPCLYLFQHLLSLCLVSFPSCPFLSCSPQLYGNKVTYFYIHGPQREVYMYMSPPRVVTDCSGCMSLPCLLCHDRISVHQATCTCSYKHIHMYSGSSTQLIKRKSPLTLTQLNPPLLYCWQELYTL